MNPNEIIKTIKSFPRWHYEFDLQGNRTPIADPVCVNRHLQRRAYFFDPMVKLLGGSLAGKRVLDLGCNAGFWSLHCIDAGAREVIGIDGRQMHIDQANFVFDVKKVDKNRYQFITANIFDLDFEKFGRFEVVLCLGLLYHVRHPILLLEKIAAVNDYILVIDTALSLVAGSYLQLKQEGIADPRNSLDSELVFCPSKQAVLDMVHSLGYRCRVLRPRMRNYSGAQDYENGTRRAFLCAKESRN